MRKILFFLLLAASVDSNAQDILIKTDKTEIKVKLVEITETALKYKKWENLDGPIYNIAKGNIFMIVYANGQREIVKPESSNASNKSAEPQPNLITENKMSKSYTNSYTAPAGTATVDTTIDFKNIKVKYKPSRFLYWFQSPPTTIGYQQELRIIKNTVNVGAATDYFFVSGYSQTLYSLYIAPYLPVNRLIGNYKKQDKGLFVNAKIGYSSLSVSFEGKSASQGGLMYGVGLDYFITHGFGLTLSTFKFDQSKFMTQGGICLNFL